MKKTGEITEVTLANAYRSLIYEVYPGILFAFNHVHTSTLPTMPQTMDDCICTINYAASGTCGLYSSNGKYIYLRSGELMISNEQAANSFEYPVGSYCGVEIYIMRKVLEHSEKLAFFKIDVEQMLYTYLPEQYQTVIAENLSLLKNTLADISMLYEMKILDLNLLRLHIFYILRLLTAGVIESHSGYEGALTKSQVDMAKKAEHILTANLADRKTIAHIAGTMGISPSSLKNYFKAVYGQNISDYLRGKRIERAKKLLIETKYSILEIANQVGFESQSKFTEMFHTELSLTPTEYRRTHR
ncbi:MAG: AraC family transcriptional regulator [Eubacteriales bacterium]|nr:AraC family transcriptional regulator [Eubacteriales bacterium]